MRQYLYGSWEPCYVCSGFTWQDLWKALGFLEGVCETPPWISLKSWQSCLLGLILRWRHFLVWESFVAWTGWKWELVLDSIVCFWARLSPLTLCHPQRAGTRSDSGCLPGSPFSWALSSFCPFQFPSCCGSQCHHLTQASVPQALSSMFFLGVHLNNNNNSNFPKTAVSTFFLFILNVTLLEFGEGLPWSGHPLAVASHEGKIWAVVGCFIFGSLWAHHTAQISHGVLVLLTNALP